METILILKIICMFLTILFTLVNTVKVIGGTTVPAMNFILQAAGITGFIVFQWMI